MSAPQPTLSCQTSSQSDTLFPSEKCITVLHQDKWLWSWSPTFCSLFSRSFPNKTLYNLCKRLKHVKENSTFKVSKVQSYFMFYYLTCRTTLHSALPLKWDLLWREQLSSNIDFPQTHQFVALPICQRILDYTPGCDGVTFHTATVSVSYRSDTDLGFGGGWEENRVSPQQEPEPSSHNPASWGHESQRSFTPNFYLEISTSQSTETLLCR